MSGYVLTYDRRIRAPRWGRASFDGAIIHVPLVELCADIRSATQLPGARVAAALGFTNRGDGTGELAFPAARVAPAPGRHSFEVGVRYSDGIQHVDDLITAEVIVAARLAVVFTAHGTLRVAFPAGLAVTPALVDPRSYRIVPLVPTARPLAVTRVGREERRRDPATGRIVAVSDPTYVELEISPAAAGMYRLLIPVLRAFGGGLFGPASEAFEARLVKRVLGARTIGPRSASALGRPAAVVLDALFAEDERVAGRARRQGGGRA